MNDQNQMNWIHRVFPKERKVELSDGSIGYVDNYTDQPHPDQPGRYTVGIIVRIPRAHSTSPVFREIEAEFLSSDGEGYYVHSPTTTTTNTET